MMRDENFRGNLSLMGRLLLNWREMTDDRGILNVVAVGKNFVTIEGTMCVHGQYAFHVFKRNMTHDHLAGLSFFFPIVAGIYHA